MERRVVTNRIGIKKCVSDALQLDGGQDENAAYIKYLECMQTIISSLLLDASSFGDVTNDTTNFVKLGVQCMERISLIVDSLPKASMQQKPTPLSFPPTNSLNSFDSEPVERGYSSLPVMRQQSYVPPATPTSLILESPTERFASAAANVPSLMASPTSSSAPQVQKQVDESELSPIEVAQRQNKKLLAAYQARMARSGSTKQHQATLNLTLQRKMAENLAVAEARQKTITRKLEERHQRLQQEAMRRFENMTDMSKEELERHHLYTEILDYEKSRNNLVVWRQRLEKSPEDNNIILGLVNTILSLPDHPLTQLIYKYQHATYNKLGPLVEKYASKPPTISSKEKLQDSTDASRTSLSQNATETTSSDTQNEPQDDQNGSDNKTQLGNQNDSDKDKEKDNQNGSQNHTSDTKSDGVIEACDKLGPVSDSVLSPSISEFEEITSEEITRMEVEALRRHLRNIVADVHSYLEQLQCMFTVAYQALGTASGKDICYSAIEEPFFKPIWGYLAALFRIVDGADEEKARAVMEKYGECAPAVLKVPARYCLHAAAVPTRHPFPYAPAVTELQGLGRLVSPLAQLECIVRVSKLICSCVEEFQMSLGKPETTGLGADDLLPILSYVIVRSRRPQLVAECHVLEEFIHEGYLIGEEGYCLTSLQTALGYVLSLIDRSPH